MYCLFQCVFPVQNRSHDVFVNFLRWKTVMCAVLCNHIFCFSVERNWKIGQPDNWSHGHEPGEDCAGLIYAGLWNDFYCEDVNNFICEKDMDKGKQGAWFVYFTLPIVNFPQLEGRRRSRLDVMAVHCWGREGITHGALLLRSSPTCTFVILCVMQMLDLLHSERAASKLAVAMACFASWPSPTCLKFQAWFGMCCRP